ncbi:MAG: hypothetical protein OEZ59_06535 [Deltaproteobacteria bacterium]|nr:hypothetical protein [Deltaproteobacteria bacterium]
MNRGNTQARRLAVLGALYLLLATGAAAPAAGQELSINPQATIRMVLEQHTGKTVEVTLASGEKLSGKVVSVGQFVLHLSRLGGRDFYDSAVRIEAIQAVAVRVRNK